MVPSLASFRLSWLSSMLCQAGQLASSKSAIQQLAPELSAFMVILRSGGPVSSTRLSCRSSGIGAIFQSPSLTSLVSGRKSARNATGKEPETPQTLSAPASQWQARPLRNDAPESPPSAGPCTVPESYFHLSSLHRESKIPTPQILFQLFAHITYIGENYTCEPYKLNATAGSVADKALQAPC